MAECAGARGCSRGCGARGQQVAEGGGELTHYDYPGAVPQASQKPYRVGLLLLCMGALFNWLGLAQAYVEPMRYVGVGCIVAGALLICAAMCRWLGRSSNPNRSPISPHLGSGEMFGRSEGGLYGHPHHPSVHIISLSPNLQSKPPDYDSLVGGDLPSYEDAIKYRLSPDVLVAPAGPEELPEQGPNHATKTSAPHNSNPAPSNFS